MKFIYAGKQTSFENNSLDKENILCPSRKKTLGRLVSLMLIICLVLMRVSKKKYTESHV
jgi:hypothetical protein